MLRLCAATAQPCYHSYRSLRHGSMLVLAVLTLLVWSGPAAFAQAADGESTDSQTPQITEQDGPIYEISRFDLQTSSLHPDFPDAALLKGQPITLGHLRAEGDEGEVYVGRRFDERVDVETTLREIEQKAPVRVSRSALEEIRRQLANHLHGRNVEQATVEFEAGQIDLASGADQRDDTQVLALEVDGQLPYFRVSDIEIQYGQEHPDLPAVQRLEQFQVTLGEYQGAYVRHRPGLKATQLELGSLGQASSAVFFPSAIQSINERLVQHFNEQGLLGIFVVPNQADLQRARRERTTLRLAINVVTVGAVRTLAAGDRIAREDRINHALHDRIRRNSPIHAAAGEDVEEADGSAGEADVVEVSGEVEGSAAEDEPAAGPVEQGDLIRKKDVDRYIYWLNRHPGRRTDLSIAAGDAPGEVVVDYLVSENKPWYAYAQVSNTGTEATSEIREQFAFVHNQVTNNDDIFRLNYVTANFDDTHAVLASYEAPLGELRRVRWRVEGAWNEYTASDVGQAGENFRGDGWHAGGELIANVYQQRELFIDLYGGAEWRHSEVINETFKDLGLIIEGETDFFMPVVGLRLDRRAEQYETWADIGVQWNMADVAGTDEDDLARLGRSNPDTDWVKAFWELRHSFYLEPLLDRAAWEDPATPKSSTLAHEIALEFRGQYAFDNRLPPESQQTIGGLYTVRGYEESSAAGDTVLLGRAEYRLHMPYLFEPTGPDEMFGEPFRWAPQRVYGSPDWDLIFRGFVDVGHSEQSHRIENVEENYTLVGAGVGAELQIKNNINLRADWGFVLEGEEFTGGEEVEAGDSRLHFVGTILY